MLDNNMELIPQNHAQNSLEWPLDAHRVVLYVIEHAGYSNLYASNDNSVPPVCHHVCHFCVASVPPPNLLINN